MSQTLNKKEVDAILHTDLHDAFSLLGAHLLTKQGKKQAVVRALLRDAKAVVVAELDGERREWPMECVHQNGLFELVAPERQQLFRYELRITDFRGGQRVTRDPYSFWPILGELDLHLFNEGNHLRLWEKLGAHVMTVDGVSGVHFAVWAPNARRVSVVGDFNGWDGRWHPMRALGASGVWELFVPGLKAGEKYKFEIKTHDGLLRLKTDPLAFYHEVRPSTSSIVWDINRYEWQDGEWMEKRAKTAPLEKPVSIYEVHLGSWRRGVHNEFLTYRQLAEQLIDYVVEMGYTHVELLPVAEHPFDGSWGYQVTGYYAPTSRFGEPEDFMYFVDRCHQRGIGVIVDWVPAHFPKDDFALRWFDGTALYEHADPRKGEHQDWGTMIFNYGRHEVRNFLVANALFWFDRYHIDGLRVDAVASMLYLDYSRKAGEWIPNQYGGNENLEAIAFMKRTNEVVYGQFPGVMMIAEESTAFQGVSKPVYLGGLGFGFKWNMGWMHDVLDYFSKEPIYRRYHQNNLTFGLVYAFFENFVLVLSHDEVVHGKQSLLSKMRGDDWQKFANMRLLLAFMTAHPGKKMLFMGAELGQWKEWDCAHSLDWHLLDYDRHKALQRVVKDLNHFYRTEPALWEQDHTHQGFEWIDFHDADSSVVTFLRRSKTTGEPVICVFNFTPVVRKDYRVGVPDGGFYRELFNTDAGFYGGSDTGNAGGVVAEPVQQAGRPHSIKVTLPPLGALMFKRSGLPTLPTPKPPTETSDAP
ncbi:MAG: 1,4-alpha-glucan branching protein GlgB [Verrucomicrobia bacterium]|nr:1,4-alpha-glucan branching protein GlgB [Verrucomicrobiota bacterium]